MGKLYLVEELERKNEEIPVAVYIVVGIVISIFANYLLLDSIRDTVNGLIYKTGKLDAEMIGVIVGIIVAWSICLGLFISRIYEGLTETIFSLFGKLLILNVVLMTIGSIAVPSILSLVFYAELGISIWKLLLTTIFNFIIFTLCTPLISIGSMTIVVILGLILSFPIYNIIYRLKYNRIKRTKCWEEIKRYISNDDFKNKVLTINLYHNKIQFYTISEKLDYEISFSNLGYSSLTPIMQLTLSSLILKQTKIKFKIKSVQGGIIVLRNKELERQYNKCEKNYHNYWHRAKKHKINIEKRMHRKRVKEGKDW